VLNLEPCARKPQPCHGIFRLALGQGMRVARDVPAASCVMR
jgi:hypothetical protein